MWASCNIGPSLPRGREAGVWQSQSRKARSCGNLSPGACIFHQTVSMLPVASYVFLGSWMVDICQECHSLRSAPQRHRVYLWWCSRGAPGEPQARTREVIKMRGASGTVCSSSTGLPELLGPGRYKTHSPSGPLPCKALENLSSSDLGIAWNVGPTWDSALAEHPGA